jgi:hypothetical protein
MSWHFWGPFCKFYPFLAKNSRKVQKGPDQKGDVLEKKVLWGFFLELDIESTKNINFEILDLGWHFCLIFACLTWNDPIVPKSAVRFVLGWNFHYKTQVLTLLCRNLYGGTLSMSNFKILGSFFVPGPQYIYQRCHQIYSSVKFVNKTCMFPFWDEICMGGTLRTQKSHENRPLELKQQNLS